MKKFFRYNQSLYFLISGPRKNKNIAMLLSIFLILTILTPTKLYASDLTDPNYGYALKLKELGVFIGSSSGFELERIPTRLEGVIMLVRLLGKEVEANSMVKDPCVFTDVDDWAVGYVNYAKSKNLTLGKSSTLFGSNDQMSATEYLTFLLRSLNYNDSKGDFLWSDALTKAKEIGLIKDTTLLSGTFTRSQVVRLSYDALLTPIKLSNTSLAQYLVNLKAIDETTAVAINIINNPAVIDGKTFAFKDAIFYDLGESNTTVDVVSSASVQNSVKTDVYRHISNKTSATSSLLILPIEGYLRLTLRIITDSKKADNTLDIYDGKVTTLNQSAAIIPVTSYKVLTDSSLINVDLTTNTEDYVTLKINLNGTGNIYIYSLFLQ